MSPEVQVAYNLVQEAPEASHMATKHAPNDSHVIITDLIENAGVRYTLVVLHVLAIIVSSLGNGFLIVFICRHWKQTHRNVTAILILNLAMCDFINIVVHQPMKLVDLLVHHEQNLTYCQVSGFFSSFFSGVAFSLMVAIGQERFLLICQPFQAKRFLTLKNTVIVMVSIWCGVALCTLPLPIGFIYVRPIFLGDGEATFCIVNLDSDTSSRFRADVYVSLLFVIFFVIPLVVLCLSYISIFRELYRHLPGHKHKNEATTRVLAQRKSLAKVMLSVAVIFVVSNGPKWVALLVGLSKHDIKKNPIFTMLVLDLLTMLSPMMNPIVYSLRFRTMRKGLTHGGSIYSAIKHMSLNRNSSSLPRSEHAASTSNNSTRPLNDDDDVVERDLSPIREESPAMSSHDGELLPLKHYSGYSDVTGCISSPSDSV